MPNRDGTGPHGDDPSPRCPFENKKFEVENELEESNTPKRNGRGLGRGLGRRNS